MIIAIDGPAASGKGTLGKKLAAHYGLRHLDTGLIYRSVAKSLIDNGRLPGDIAAAVAAAHALDPTRFDEKVLKSHMVGEAISPPNHPALCSMAAISARLSAPVPTQKSLSPRRPRCGPAAGPWNTKPPGRRSMRPQCWPTSKNATTAT
jgi:hypothetical protein